MKTFFISLLFFLFFSIQNLSAWTSSNDGVCYTMDTLCLLSGDINYNTVDQMYEVDCDIVILENDTLRIYPGEKVMFFQYFPPGNTIQYGIIVYGCLIAIGEKENTILFGDPDATFSTGNWWNGIQFYNTSQGGESILKYCHIRGATHLDWELETALLCDNSSPIIDQCKFYVMASGEETGGASAIGLIGESYPVVSYCVFDAILNGMAIWCNPYNIQDTVNYPSPLIIGCNVSKTVQGCNWPPLDYDVVIYNGGFLDNCYLPVPFGNFPDTTLGYPIDTIGDGICNTNSTYELHPKFLMVDGVVNPRDTFLITGINEKEIEILPTTSNHLILRN